MCKAGLKLVIADLLIPGIALRTRATAANERYRDAVTDGPLRDALADRLDDTGQLMSGYMWQFDIGIVPLPTVPVTAANTTGHDFYYDAAVNRDRVRHLFNCG